MRPKYYRIPGPGFKALSATAESSTSIKVTGELDIYGDPSGVTSGVAYKAASAADFTHKAVSSKVIDTTLTGLAASTTYEVRLYYKRNGAYTYSVSMSVTTPA